MEKPCRMCGAPESEHIPFKLISLSCSYSDWSFAFNGPVLMVTEAWVGPCRYEPVRKML